MSLFFEAQLYNERAEYVGKTKIPDSFKHYSVITFNHCAYVKFDDGDAIKKFMQHKHIALTEKELISGV